MSGLAAYEQFVAAKTDFARYTGFEIDPAELHRALLPHQRDIVAWALRGGRRAIFAAFGLGKSIMQLEALRQISDRERAPVLIVCPLGVRQEFARDARELLDTPTTFIRDQGSVVRAGRRGRGVELNADYWRDACAYLRAQDHEVALPTLFDLNPAEVAA